MVVADGTLCLGAVDRTLGVVATALGRLELAEAHFERACELNDRLGARASVRTWRGYAEMLLARGADGDRAKADAMIAKACHCLRTLGMALELQRLEALVQTG